MSVFVLVVHVAVSLLPHRPDVATLRRSPMVTMRQQQQQQSASQVWDALTGRKSGAHHSQPTRRASWQPFRKPTAPPPPPPATVDVSWAVSFATEMKERAASELSNLKVRRTSL